MNVSRWILPWAILPAFLACHGSDDRSSSSGASYSKTCVRNPCEVCEDTVVSACNRCNDLCSRPGAYAGCFSDCGDICGTSCSACSETNTCQEWKVEVPIPELDPALYDLCLRSNAACFPDEDPYPGCNIAARTLQPKVSSWYECLLSQSCDTAGCNGTWPSLGTMGTAFCARKDHCGNACFEGFAHALDDLENALHPQLKRSVQECIAELSCAEFEACSSALERIWIIGDSPQ
jgi:hypothetical protein